MKEISYRITLTRVAEDYQPMPDERFKLINGEDYKIEGSGDLKETSQEYGALLSASEQIIPKIPNHDIEGFTLSLEMKVKREEGVKRSRSKNLISESDK